MEKENQEQIYRLRLAYIVGLSLIALCSVIRQFIIWQETKRQKYDSHLINIAGGQRMLSQALANACLWIRYAQEDSVAQKQRQELSKHLSTFQRVHTGLQKGSIGLGLPADESKEIKLLFEDIAPIYQQMTRACQQIILSQQYRDSSTIYSTEVVLKNAPFFLQKMNLIVNRYEKEAIERIDDSEKLQIILLAAILFLLVLEGLLIFRPVTAQISHYLTQIEVMNKQIAQNLKAKEESNEALKKAAAIQNEMLSITVHDLKSPINRIKGLVELLGLQYPAIKESQELPLIKLIADRMSLTLSEFMETVFFDNREMHLEIVTIDLKVLLTEVIEELYVSAREKQQKIIFENTHSDKVLISGDIERWREVFDNLIGNAIKYSFLNTEIKVSLKKVAQNIQIHIKDQGQGLNETDLQKLFGRFTRLSAKPTGGEHSSGLGLYITKKIVELHHGKIWAESEGERMGATFVIELLSAGE